MSAWRWQRRRLLLGRKETDTTSLLDLVIAPLIGAALVLRVLIDNVAPTDSRHTGSLNISGVLALVLILTSAAILAWRRRGVPATVLSALWIGIWTAVAVSTNGISAETFREGVRELSVISIAVIVYNAPRAVTLRRAGRIVQAAGIAPALVALFQLATNTGLDVAHNVRANGTFAHPNSAAMFFAIATCASLWCYLDCGRHRLDVLLVALFAAALLATFSIDGLVTLAAMLATLGAMRRGPIRAKLGPLWIAVVIILAFVATPLGSHRIAGETSTSISAAERGETTSTFDTRLYRWKTLVPEWERSPFYGRGLGTTTTSENTAVNRLNSLLPHNEILRYLVETGLVGLTILLAGIAMLIRGLLRRRPVPLLSQTQDIGASALALSVVVGCLVNSLADNTLLNSPTCYASALIVAAVLGIPRSDTPEPGRARIVAS